MQQQCYKKLKATELNILLTNEVMVMDKYLTSTP